MKKNCNIVNIFDNMDLNKYIVNITNNRDKPKTQKKQQHYYCKNISMEKATTPTSTIQFGNNNNEKKNSVCVHNDDNSSLSKTFHRLTFKL